MCVQSAGILRGGPGHLPEGMKGRGWCNIDGDSPLGGHIKKDNCPGLTCVGRGFHGRRSCSVWFMNAAGGAMFKIFVRRDENKELRAEQLAKFEALRDGFRG